MPLTFSIKYIYLTIYGIFNDFVSVSVVYGQSVG
jgi:hypothetical protein